MRHRFSGPVPIALAILIAAFLLNFIGCQMSETLPTSPVPDLGRELASEKAAALPVVSTVVGVVQQMLHWLQPAVHDPEGSQTFELNGAKGGVFTYGRYQVAFPPDAVQGNGHVTIAVPDGSVVGCDLTISPPTLNGFSKQVTLTMDCHDTNGGLPLPVGLAIFWRSGNQWVNLGGDLVRPTKKLSTGLWHFSNYRAGW